MESRRSSRSCWHPLVLVASATAASLLISLILQYAAEKEWQLPTQSGRNSALISPHYAAYELEHSYNLELEQFNKFAALRNCSKQRQYDIIFETLQPYEEGGISEEMLTLAFQQCHQPLHVEIKNHTVAAAFSDGPIDKPGRLEDLAHRADWLIKFFTRLAPSLPDTRLVANLMDEPCSWMSPLPAEAEDAHRNGRLGLKEAWLQHGCDGTGMQRMKHLHGFFVSPMTFPATRAKVPAWSMYSIPGCFGDLVIPNFGAWSDDDKRVCPPSGTPKLQDKIQRAIFRGSSTGGYAGDEHTAEHYSRFHRQRLVEFTKKLDRSDIDAGITRYIQCSPQKCDEMEARYGNASRMEEKDILNSAYLIVLDGNGGVERLTRYMCSGSLVLLGEVFHEWYFSGMEPYEHYLPLDIDYHNLPELVDWAKAHPAEAEAIALRGARYIAEEVRNEDMECYTFKLVVEYNRLRRKGMAKRKT